LNPIRVLIVDDQHLFAESLKFVLHGESEGKISVIGIAENGKIAVDLVEKYNPDIVLMDIRMPLMDGVEATTQIHKYNKKVKIIILTTFDDDELAVSALSGGASGYVLKDVDPKDLIRCIEAVYKGAYYISPSVGIKLFDMIKTSEQGVDDEKERLIIGYLNHISKLSRRESEILYYVARAKSNKEIADELYISEKTVKNHLNSIYTKLKIHNRLQLINHILALSDKIRNI
jgi:DNA-binding NarL/FixJ family response regulator